MSWGGSQECPSCGAQFGLGLERCPSCDALAPPPDDLDFAHEYQGSDDPGTGAWRTLGASLDADIVVSSSNLSARGVQLRRLGDRVQLQKIDPGVVVTVGGRKVDGDVTVSLDLSVVTVDGVLLTEEMVPQDTLAVELLPDAFDPIIIGRAPDCSLVIDNPAVSAHHARITRQDGGVLLEDLDSANAPSSTTDESSGCD